MFACYFVDPGLAVEAFFKNEGPQDKEQVDFEIGAETPAAHLHWG